MFLHVVSAEMTGKYTLAINFSNGETREIDLVKELYGPVFEPLRDETYFAQFVINPETGTIEWPSGADFAPEFLLAHGRRIELSGHDALVTQP